MFDVAAHGGLVCFHVLAAGTVQRVEVQVLVCRTYDFRVRDADGQHTADEVRKWRDAVHEIPETWELCGSSKDTAE